MKNLNFVWRNRQQIPPGWRILLLVLTLATAAGLTGALCIGFGMGVGPTANVDINVTLAVLSFAIIGIAHGGLLVYAVLHDTPEVSRSGERE